AFCCRGVLRWAAEEGLGVDVCTGGELEVALAAGVDPAMITMHGNNKLLSELERAVATGVGHVVVDSFEEIARLAFVTEERDGVAGGIRPADDRIAPKKDEPRPPRVLVRVTTGVEAHTHDFVATAHDDQKFGFSLSSGAADEAVSRGLAAPSPDFAGLPARIGSQTHEPPGVGLAAHPGLQPAARSRDGDGVHMAELTRGGGFGIAYTPADDPADIKVVAQSLYQIVAAQCAAAGLDIPRLTVEPGRAIAGPGTVTLY